LFIFTPGVQQQTTPLGNRHFLASSPDGFSNETATLALTGLPSHSQVTLDFDLFIIRTWDGSYAGGPGPDRWMLNVAGGPTLLDTTFSTFGAVAPWYQAYPDAYPAGNHLPGTGAVEHDTLGFPYFGVVRDSVYHLSFSFANTASALSFVFSAAGLQGGTDESWGLDNVQVRLGALPFDQQMNATCPSCQFHTPFPVNTRTGNYWNKVTDLHVESPAFQSPGRAPITARRSMPPLSWARAGNIPTMPGLPRRV
jgi:hypothetical protein